MGLNVTVDETWVDVTSRHRRNHVGPALYVFSLSGLPPGPTHSPPAVCSVGGYLGGRGDFVDDCRGYVSSRATYNDRNISVDLF